MNTGKCLLDVWAQGSLVTLRRAVSQECCGQEAHRRGETKGWEQGMELMLNPDNSLEKFDCEGGTGNKWGV